jgi:LysR family transcriptional regulator, benzoate and cis,cis-muconate-responsive activator of ben and cat genes
MELRQLRYFVAVAEEANISRAAQKMFLTQSALSRQIKVLEEEIGQCLFERQAHSIRLTPPGEALLRDARDLLQRADQILDRVRAAAHGVRLRVGYAPSLASGLLSIAVENFAQKHPTAHVELFDLSTKEMLTGLENDSLDVALTAGVDRDKRGLKWTPLTRVTWKLAVNSNHPMARQTSVTPSEVALGPLLVFCQRDYPEYWNTVTSWLREHGQRSAIAGEYDGVNSLMAAVESGLGIAIVTTSTAWLVPKRVRLKSLSVAPNPLSIAAGHRAHRSTEKPLAVFIEELRQAAKAIV